MEASLWQKAQAGDTIALNMLLGDHYAMTYGFLIKVTGDRQRASDLTQDTMIRAVVNLHKFRGDAKFSSWLIRIAINTYKNDQKKYKKQMISYDQDLPMVPSHDVSLEEVVEDKMDLALVLSILQKQKPVNRTIFILKFYEGYTYEEISLVTGIKVGTCKSKAHYTLEKIRKELEVL